MSPARHRVGCDGEAGLEIWGLALLGLLWVLLHPGRRGISPDSAPRLLGLLGSWERYAREHGLRWRQAPMIIGSELSGTVDGRRIRAVVCEPPAARRGEPLEVRLVVEIRAGISPELELLYNPRLVPVGYTLLSPELEPGGRGLLARREHRQQLEVLLADPDTLAMVAEVLQRYSGRLQHGQLEAWIPGLPDPAPHVAELLGLSGRIQAAWEASWRELAVSLGLHFRPVSRQGQWQLRGTRDGVPLTVRCTRREIRLMAGIRDVPEGLSVVAEDRPGQRSGNPILDHLLCVRGAHPCLQDAALAGALMAALHPHPGASLDATGLHIPAAPDADIAGLILLAVAVQEALCDWRSRE